MLVRPRFYSILLALSNNVFAEVCLDVLTSHSVIACDVTILFVCSHTTSYPVQLDTVLLL